MRWLKRLFRWWGEGESSLQIDGYDEAGGLLEMEGTNVDMRASRADDGCLWLDIWTRDRRPEWKQHWLVQFTAASRVGMFLSDRTEPRDRP